MDRLRLERVLARFPGKRILVIGDVILDCYWWGEANRLSPEAPVLVLRKKRTTVQPGGAANTAANLAALGAQVDLIGLIGDDASARELTHALEQQSINTTNLVRDSSRPTTTKTRLIAMNHHLLRVDEEETTPIDETNANLAIARARENMASIDALVLSDYAKGMLSAEVVREVIAIANEAGKPVFVDPKGADYKRYRGAAYLKPNRLELSVLTGQADRDAGRLLVSLLETTNVLVTEGADGMTLFTVDGSEYHVSSEPQQVFDVTGAGDTVLAAFSMAICSGASATEAMWLAARAAEIAIRTVGAAIVTLETLKASALQSPALQPA